MSEEAMIGMSARMFEDMLAMSTETAAAGEWELFDNLLVALDEQGYGPSASWLSYAVVAIGADDALRVIRESTGARENVVALMGRFGAALPADPSLAVERIRQVHDRLARLAPRTADDAQHPATCAAWLYSENPALGADERNAHPKGEHE